MGRRGKAMPALTPAARNLLAVAANGGITVIASNLIEAAEVLTADYVRVEDDYEGPRIYLTEKGEKFLAK